MCPEYSELIVILINEFKTIFPEDMSNKILETREEGRGASDPNLNFLIEPFYTPRFQNDD